MKYMVAFSSPKRSAAVVEIAAQQAKALQAELILLRVIPDAEKVGVVAQLIATDRPIEKAQEQIDQTVQQLKTKGIEATGIVKVGEVGPGIIKTAQELGIDIIFVGTTNFHVKPAFFMTRDPIVHYLVDHCPISLCLIRHDEAHEQAAIEEEKKD
jgi:nucleotide-binding universal stress UspA family protein